MQVRVGLELGLLMAADGLHVDCWNAGLRVFIYVELSCPLTVLLTQ